MRVPNSRRNLDRAITRIAGSQGGFVRARTSVANALVGQMLPNGAVKGGSSLKIRFGDVATRATTDLDAARATDIDEFIADMADSLAQGWNGFTGRTVPVDPATPRDVPPSYVMQPFDIKLEYLGRSWCTVRFELGHNEIGDADSPEFCVPAEANRILVQLGFPEIDAVPLMPLHHQIAQKLHGVSEPSGRRAHDLIDLQVIFANAEVDLPLVRRTCEKLFAYRKMQDWPPILVKGEGWDALYADQVLPSVKPTADEAVEWANELIAMIMQS